MNIPSLGPLHVDKSIPEWLVSQPVTVPCFDNLPLTFTLNSLTAEDVVDTSEAVAAFLGLGARDRMAASPFMFQNYRRMADAVSEADLDCWVMAPEEVWAHVHPTEVFVSRRRRDGIIYVQVTAECDWEREHGLQIIYRQGNELSRVSAQDGHLTHADAYGLPDTEDKIA